MDTSHSSYDMDSAGPAAGLPRRPRRARTALPARIGRWVELRIYIAGAFVSLLFVGIGYKAYGLQVDQAAKYRKLAQRQHVRTVEVPAPRGPIIDVQGRELAVTADASSVFANPREVVDVAASAEILAGILDLDVRAVEAKLATKRHFVWLERHVSDDRADAVRSADLHGIYLTPEPRRFYPGKTLAGPLLGFAGIDGNGLDGIELKMDELLTGHRARFAALRDASGRTMMSEGMARPQPGATIRLTIDRSVQFIAERALEDTVHENQATAGLIVILDVKSGEVMAMANWPTYDPSSPAGAVKARARNRAVTDAFEIGSVMKVFTVAAALDAGVVNTSEYIDVEQGKFKVGRKLISDTYHDFKLTVSGVLKRSSNVGAVKIAQRLGKERLQQALVRFGFGTETGVELPGERSGVLRPAKQWSDIGLASVSFGYGMTVTAMQVAAGLAAIGNHGIYHEPRLIREVSDASGELLYRHQPQGRPVLREDTAAALLPMLASVFEKGALGGTARHLHSDSFAIGGKTGTARKIDPATHQYSQELHISSFAGLAPIDDPRIAVVVVIDEPRGEHYYGGRVAGPAFVRVVDGTLRYLGVPPKAEAPGTEHAAAHAHGGEPAEPRSPPPAIADVEAGHAGDGLDMDDFADIAVDSADMVVIPDFTGMSIKQALDSARRAGIAVQVEGSGRAVRQAPPPGPAAWPGTCRIIFVSPHDPRPAARDAEEP